MFGWKTSKKEDNQKALYRVTGNGVMYIPSSEIVEKKAAKRQIAALNKIDIPARGA